MCRGLCICIYPAAGVYPCDNAICEAFGDEAWVYGFSVVMREGLMIGFSFLPSFLPSFLAIVFDFVGCPAGLLRWSMRSR